MSLIIKVSQEPVASNVCRQILKEIYRLKNFSIAHVKMLPGSVSILHIHKTLIEIYYILSGKGKMQVGKNVYKVQGETLVEIPVYTPHKLQNEGKQPLKHLVICSPIFDPEDIVLLEDENEPQRI